MEEIWKDIDGYPNYQVSNMGRVKSLNYKRTGKEKILKLNKHKFGYFMVSLRKNGITSKICVHRLVAKAFIPNPENKPEIDHINTNQSDNRVENLRWVTSKENSNNPITIKHCSDTRKTMIGSKHPKSKPIIQLTLNGEFVRKWDSATQVSKKLTYSQDSIWKCCKRKRKTAYNYIWGYADDYEQIPFKVFDLEIYRKKVV